MLSTKLLKQESARNDKYNTYKKERAWNDMYKTYQTGERRERLVQDSSNRREPEIICTKLIKPERGRFDKCMTYRTERAKNDKYMTYQTGISQE